MATRASLIEILEWIDPTALPEQVQNDLEEIGPFLASGLTYREIGALTGRSEDYVAAVVKRIRAALVDEALRHADGMSEALRSRLEELAAKQRRSDRTVPARASAGDRHEAEHLERLRLQGQAPLRV